MNYKILGIICLFLCLTGCGHFFDDFPHKGDIPEIIDTVDLRQYKTGRPVDIVSNPETGHIYVVTQGDKIVIFQGTQVITKLPVGHQATPSLTINIEQDLVYTLGYFDNTVTIIQGTDVLTTLIITGEMPRAIAIDENTGHAYVGSLYHEDTPEGEKKNGGFVTVIDKDKVIDSITLNDQKARVIAVDPSGYTYVGTTDGIVFVIKDMEIIKEYALGIGIANMSVNQTTGDVYILSVDVTDFHRFYRGELIESVSIKASGGSMTAMEVHPVTGDVYVVDYVPNELMVIRDMEIIARVPVGNNPHKMAIDPLTENVYVANDFDSTVTVIQGTEVISTIQVGWYPFGIGVNPSNGWVYVSNTNEHSVTILGFPDE
jgi:YVTN family beta-propeller protein